MRLLLILALAGGGYYYWTEHKAEIAATTPGAMVSSASTPEPPPSPNGFIALPAMDSAGPQQVLVFAPVNCPSEVAQQADGMARELTMRGIPAQRVHDVSFTSTDPDPRIGRRLNQVMNGQLPIVFVNGRGKANPTLDQVVAEYGLR